MDVQPHTPDKLHDLVVFDELFEADECPRGHISGVVESGGAPASGEAEDAFGSDSEDEFALGVEVEEGFVVDGSVDVEEVDGGPSFGEVPVAGEDLFGGEMVVVDHVADFAREAEEMAWSLGRGTRSVLSVCERHLDLNTV